MAKLKIWGRNTSSNVQKVLWCCGELSLPFDRVDIGGPFGGNDDPKYRTINPNGLVPTIEDGDFILWESNTIVRYLARKYGKDDLYPRNLEEAALAERWMDWLTGHMLPAFNPVFWGYVRTPPEKRDMAAIKAAEERSGALWQMVDAHLAKSHYMNGKTFSVADIPLGIYAYRWFTLVKVQPDLPNVRAWYARLTERPAFKEHIMHPLK